VSSDLLDLYRGARSRTEDLAAPLSPEDQSVQSMPEASPTKWHRAHTTWFFETFVLAPRGISPLFPEYGTLFNSYYDAVGPRHARAERGVLSRPTLEEVDAYRRAVDGRVEALLSSASPRTLESIGPLIRLGVAHEEQHQELMLTDILHAFSENPMRPRYREPPPEEPRTREPSELRFIRFDGGLVMIGAPDSEPFAFDHERPRHRRFVEPFALSDRLLTVREMKAFIEDRGYRTPSLWLSDGWSFACREGLAAPLHATLEDGEYVVMSLDGPRRPADDEPILHLSFYEADALARYLGARLPFEAEWEFVAASVHTRGNFVESGALHGRAAPSGAGVKQMFGDAWEWTRSSYEPYPGYAPPAGALGEYNAKFMIDQLVLRGGSCLTPERHVRASYRNYWPAATRFQATGVRLARAL
jgi:ergothioneine biosynthesis protein EgtB